jgi:hypothetical protein
MATIKQTRAGEMAEHARHTAERIDPALLAGPDGARHTVAIVASVLEIMRGFALDKPIGTREIEMMRDAFVSSAGFAFEHSPMGGTFEIIRK